MIGSFFFFGSVGMGLGLSDGWTARKGVVIFTCGYPICFPDLLYFHGDGGWCRWGGGLWGAWHRQFPQTTHIVHISSCLAVLLPPDNVLLETIANLGPASTDSDSAGAMRLSSIPCQPPPSQRLPPSP